jgi:hypothetical protein
VTFREESFTNDTPIISTMISQHKSQKRGPQIEPWPGPYNGLPTVLPYVNDEMP